MTSRMLNIVDKVGLKFGFLPFRIYFFGGARNYISMNFLSYFATVASLNNENMKKIRKHILVNVKFLGWHFLLNRIYVTRCNVLRVWQFG